MKTLLLLISFAGTAFADPALPSKMTMADVTSLDAAFAHRQLIYTKADTDAAPYERKIQEICDRWKIPRAELGKAVGVDVNTGAITRATPPPEGAPAAPPKPADKTKAPTKK